MTRKTFVFLLLLGLAQAAAQETRIAVDVRMVEVYATVLDRQGRFVDQLGKDKFRVSDNGVLQLVTAFESEGGAISCALLIDTTGSMQAALPSVKNSARRFIDEMRPEDAVAVYAFTTSLQLVQGFTKDHALAKQAILGLRAGGATALFDAIAQVSHEIAGRNGKKGLVVLTDGDDNSSVLHARAAIDRAKKTGVPVYTIAEGDALRSPKLLKGLEEIAVGSGAISYKAKKSSEFGSIFQNILGEFQHTYLLAYKPPEGVKKSWRTIVVEVAESKGYKVRAKEGYYVE